MYLILSKKKKKKKAQAFLWVLSHLVLTAIAIRYYLLSVILRMKKKNTWGFKVLITNPTFQVVNGIVETWSKSACTYAFTSALFRLCIILMENQRQSKCPIIKESLSTT